MNYPIIKSAKITDDGTAMEVEFKDRCGFSQMTIKLPTEEWLRGCIEYRAAYHDKWTEMKKLMENLISYFHKVMLEKETNK